MSSSSNNNTYALWSRSSIGSDDMSPIAMEHMMLSAPPPQFVYSAVDVDAELFDVSVQSGVDSDHWLGFSSSSETSSLYGGATGNGAASLSASGNIMMSAASPNAGTATASSNNNGFNGEMAMMSDAETTLYAARLAMQQLNTLRFALNRTNDYAELAAVSDKLRVVKTSLHHWRSAMAVHYLPPHAQKSELLRRAPADPCGKLRYCLDQITAYLVECFANIVDRVRSQAYASHELSPLCAMVTTVLQAVN